MSDRRRPAPVEVTRSSVVDVPIDRVWERVTSAEGINYELGPLLRMTTPPGLAAADLADPPVGRPLGKAWLLLGGVLPVEYDALQLDAVEAPRLFHERSAMASLRVWEHRRELEEIAPGRTRVTDRLGAVPRGPLPAALARRIVTALFAHRHRRLARWAAAQTH